MLKLLEGLPENVLGVSGEGKITGTDYETVLMPAIEEKLNKQKKFFGHLLSCELRILNNREFEEAKKWITDEQL